MAKQDRGFASMDPEKQRRIASKGGKMAHVKGRAHEWTVEEAREAGRKGGSASPRSPFNPKLPLLPKVRKLESSLDNDDDGTPFVDEDLD